MSDLTAKQMNEIVMVSKKILKAVGKENKVIIVNACLMVIQLIDKTTIKDSK